MHTATSTPIDPNAPLFSLTVSQFLEMQKKNLANFNQETRRYAHSWKELGIALGCSNTKLYQMRRLGIFDAAVQRNGRCVIIDIEKAVVAFGKADRNSGRK